MARKGLFILFLLGVLAAFFYFRFYMHNKEQEPLLIERMPEGDLIGKVDVLQLARELKPFLFYNKIPFRDMLSYEFILAQGKNYGVNLQEPAYFFVNGGGEEWGAMFALSDSSRVRAGYQRLSAEVELKDTTIGKQKLVKINGENLFLTHGEKWLMLYHGKNVFTYVHKVLYTKRGEIKERWKRFREIKEFEGESLIVSSEGKQVRKYGFESLVMSQDCDSIHLDIKAFVRSSLPLGLEMKQQGMSLMNRDQSKRTVDLHLKIDSLRGKKNNPLVKLLRDAGKRVGFPTGEFLEAWEGDVSFQEGGLSMVREKYVETVMDEEFNTKQVEKERETWVPAYSLLLSMNEKQKQFVGKLFAKGIMRKDQEHYRLLTSPPLVFYQRDDHLMFFSGMKTPELLDSVSNEVRWTDGDLIYHFQLDSIQEKQLFFKLGIPLLPFLKKQKIFMK
ncbi:MAG: hypothetical protein EP338_01155 [Bacteroidetes bacterium]|nr:MAG: hypothetical protein EP338_01155 [Bacteroidota bacterium]